MRQILIWCLVLAPLAAAWSQSSLRAKQFNLSNGLAIQGYDPVAYFTWGRAAKGSKDIAYTQDGVTYYFANIYNRDVFKANPAQYEPQYGGWCAYAMGATAEKVEIEPGTYKIVNGKLYLFYNAYFTNTLPKWNKDESNLKSKADQNWLNIFK